MKKKLFVISLLLTFLVSPRVFAQESVKPYQVAHSEWILGDEIDSDEWIEYVDLVFEIDFVGYGDEWEYSFEKTSSWSVSGNFSALQDILFGY